MLESHGWLLQRVNGERQILREGWQGRGFEFMSPFIAMKLSRLGFSDTL